MAHTSYVQLPGATAALLALGWFERGASLTGLTGALSVCKEGRKEGCIGPVLGTEVVLEVLFFFEALWVR